LAQLGDQPINLGMIFRPLVGGKAEHIAVIIAKLGVAQRHRWSPSICEARATASVVPVA
jgi:hypothetical protein